MRLRRCNFVNYKNKFKYHISWKLKSAEDKKKINIIYKHRIRIEKVDEVYTDHFAVYQRYLKETRECY